MRPLRPRAAPSPVRPFPWWRDAMHSPSPLWIVMLLSTWLWSSAQACHVPLNAGQDDTPGIGGYAGGPSDQGGAPTLPTSKCPEGELAQSFNTAENTLLCSAIAADEVLRNVNKRCHFYLGWRNQCNGCSLSPSKWGRASGNTCNNGDGEQNSCAPEALDGTAVWLFGLAAEGDVDGDDTFSIGMHCDDVSTATKGAPCEADELLHGFDNGKPMCLSLTALIMQHLRSRCALHFGWSNGCVDCPAQPTKLGSVNSVSCHAADGETVCVAPQQSDLPLKMLALSPEGDVGQGDAFYLGFSCEEPSEQSAIGYTQCPLGMAVEAIEPDGTLSCVSPLPQAMALIRDACRLYLGWRAYCPDCEQPLSWGRVWQHSCFKSSGQDCVEATINETTISLLDLSVPQDMGHHDNLYLGMRCQQNQPH